MLTVSVVTPTIGSNKLRKCIESVAKQTHKTKHHLFVDGVDCYPSVSNIIADLDHENLHLNYLSENIGKGWYGHRVYAACSFLMNSDVICYLDEDNWLEPDHVEELVKVMEKDKLDWSYSLRKIYDKDENFICEDNCESLGVWPVFHNGQMHHIDTSSFAVRRDVAIKIGHAWYGQWGADRQFFQNLAHHFKKWSGSGKYTSCYRLDGNPGSVTREFFEQGNAVQKSKYPNGFPWDKR